LTAGDLDAGPRGSPPRPLQGVGALIDGAIEAHLALYKQLVDLALAKAEQRRSIELARKQTLAFHFVQRNPWQWGLRTGPTRERGTLSSLGCTVFPAALAGAQCPFA